MAEMLSPESLQDSDLPSMVQSIEVVGVKNTTGPADDAEACPSYSAEESSLASVNGDFDLKVVVRNVTEHDYHAHGARIKVEETNHWYTAHAIMPDVPASRKVVIRFRISVKSGEASAATLPSGIKLSLVRGSDKVAEIERSFPCHSFGRFTGGLRRFCPDESDGQLNVVAFGSAGAGKSAMINTFLTMLSLEPMILAPAAVGGAGDHVTLKFIHYPTPLESIQIIDSFGFDHENYNAEDLEAFLQGLVKSWNYKNSPVKDDGASVSTRLNRLPHSIILSVPVMLDEDLELFKRIKGHLKVMVNNEVSPVVLLARADEQFPDLRSAPSREQWSQELKDRINALAEKLEIPPRSIFPALPYLTEGTRVFELERLAYQILEEACHRGMTRRKFLADVLGQGKRGQILAVKQSIKMKKKQQELDEELALLMKMCAEQGAAAADHNDADDLF